MEQTAAASLRGREPSRANSKELVHAAKVSSSAGGTPRVWLACERQNEGSKQHPNKIKEQQFSSFAPVQKHSQKQYHFRIYTKAVFWSFAPIQKLSQKQYHDRIYTKAVFLSSASIQKHTQKPYHFRTYTKAVFWSSAPIQKHATKQNDFRIYTNSFLMCSCVSSHATHVFGLSATPKSKYEGWRKGAGASSPKPCAFVESGVFRALFVSCVAFSVRCGSELARPSWWAGASIASPQRCRSEEFAQRSTP